MKNKVIGYYRTLLSTPCHCNSVSIMRLLIAIVSLLLPVILNARVVAVSTFEGLRTACVTAIPGDTVDIAPGVYEVAGVSRIMIADRPGPVLVRGTGAGPLDVIIQGVGQDDPSVQMIFNLDDSPRWTFQNLMTRNSYYHGFKFDHTSTDCVLRNVVMRDHGESGVKGTSDPTAGTYPDRLLVEYCDIGFTMESGGTRDVVEGIDGVGVNDWVIRRNRFVNVQRSGSPATAIFTKGNSSRTIIEGNRFENCFIAASFGGGGTGPSFFRDNDRTYEHRGGIIRNNVMIRCADAGVYINKGTEAKIYNNTLFECGLSIQLRFVESSGWIRNNLVLPSPANPGEPILRIRDGARLLADEKNTAADSSFFLVPYGVDRDIDAHLKPGVPPIDQGMDLVADVPDDIDGGLRPEGRHFDIGADEYGAPPISSAIERYFQEGTLDLR